MRRGDNTGRAGRRARGRTRQKVGRGDPRGRAASGATVRRARGRGRLVAEPSSQDQQAAHENQLQVR